jgi:hypothetical protein
LDSLTVAVSLIVLVFPSQMKPISTAVAIAIVIAAIAGATVVLLKSCARMPGDTVSATGGAIVETGTRAANKAIDLGKRLRDGLVRSLNIQPEIRIDRETEIAFNRAVLHLTTLKREFTHEYLWEHRWAGSTKRIKLKGYFTASAGFDLSEQFFINVNSKDLRVDLKFPEPRLLACELKRYKAEVEEGWWNKLTEAERTKAVNDMVASAKRAMDGNQDLKAEAKRMLELQVASVIVQNGGTLGYANDVPFNQPLESRH